MTTFQEFHDPRLVALYDAQDPLRSDATFWVGLAAELSASTILDIGCGTGAITCALAAPGRRVTGVDPAQAMLAVARGRPGADRVRWVEGGAAAYDGPPADLALMTAHVAQVISDQDAWRDTLAAAHSALRPGGHLAFESRNPAARAWRGWTPDATRRRTDDTPLGPVDTWWSVVDVSGDLVHTEIHYRFARTGEELISSNALRFRTREELTHALTAAGFTVRQVFGDWGREPAGASRPELIFVATRG